MALAADLDEARLLAQARAVALLARRLRSCSGGTRRRSPRSPRRSCAPCSRRRRSYSSKRRSQVRDHALELASCRCACAPFFSNENSTSSPARALEQDRRASSRAACPTARTCRSRSASQTASRIWWKKALLRRSHGSIAPSRSDSSSSGTIRSGSKNIFAPMPSQAGQAPRVVEGEQARRDLGVADAAGRAGELLREQQVVALAAARS